MANACLFFRRVTGILALAGLVEAEGIGGAVAQTQLPNIVVTTPSPVTPPPAAAPAAPAQAPATTPQPAAPTAPDLSGAPLLISPDQTFVAVTVMTPGQLVSQPFATLGDALAARPGIASTTFAPGASRPVIRGLSGFRIRIQENGLSTGDVSALSDDHAIPIDPLAAGRSRSYGGRRRCAMARRPSAESSTPSTAAFRQSIPVNGILVETRGGFSTVDNGRDGAAIVEAGSGNFVRSCRHLRALGQRLSHPGGQQANTSLESEGYSLGGSYVFKDGFIGVAYTSFASTYFIPGIEAAESKNHIVLDQSKLASRGEWRVDRHRARGHPLLARRHGLQAR